MGGIINFHNNPTDATNYAEHELDRGRDEVTDAFAPYTTNAQTANPLDTYSQIMANYHLSGAAKNQMRAKGSKIRNSATANHMLGSGDEQILLGNMVNAGVQADKQQYLKNIGGITDEEHKAFQDLGKASSQMQKGFGRLISTEYDAERDSARDYVDLAKAAAQAYEKMPNENNPAMKDVEGIGELISKPMKTVRGGSSKPGFGKGDSHSGGFISGAIGALVAAL
jgi:hypothetical protein